MVVPGAKKHTFGIDMQQKGDCYITIYAWKSEQTLISGHLIDYGVVRWKDEAGDPTVEHINKFLDPYLDNFDRACVDATDGKSQDAIFDLCMLLGPKFFPLRDAANQKDKFVFKTTSDMPSFDIGQKFVSINSAMFKNEFVTSISRQNQGMWSFPSDTTKEFFNQLTNEKRVEEKEKLVWKPRYSGAAQHFFSSTIYAFAAVSGFRTQMFRQEHANNWKRGNR